MCVSEDQEARIATLEEKSAAEEELRGKLRADYDECSSMLLEAEEKLQETQGISLELLKRCQMKDEQIERLQVEMENI